MHETHRPYIIYRKGKIFSAGALTDNEARKFQLNGFELKPTDWRTMNDYVHVIEDQPLGRNNASDKATIATCERLKRVETNLRGKIFGDKTREVKDTIGKQRSDYLNSHYEAIRYYQHPANTHGLSGKVRY